MLGVCAFAYSSLGFIKIQLQIRIKSLGVVRLVDLDLRQIAHHLPLLSCARLSRATRHESQARSWLWPGPTLAWRRVSVHASCGLYAVDPGSIELRKIELIISTNSPWSHMHN